MTDAHQTSAAHTSAIARLHARLIAPRDGAWLAAFRVLFGLMMCISMLRFIAFGWIDQFFIEPAFHFKYWGFEWIEPLPAPLLHGLFWLMAALALCITLGLFFKVSAFAFAIGFAYLQLLDVATYLNHYYLANLLALLLALSPAHRFASLDALRRPALRAPSVASGWHYMFRFQIGVVYTFAGLAKAQSDWLLHGQPLRIWLGSNTDLPLLGPLFQLPGAALAMSWAGFLFDTSIPWLLSFRKTRPFAYALVLVFHTVTNALFPIGMFPVIMVLCALVFFPPDWPRTLLRLLPGTGRLAVAAPPLLQSTLSAAGSIPRRHAIVMAVAAVYCTAHLLMPLRHFVYGGSVLWHEQGMRWSWRVMVREKNGSITYRVRDKRTGKEWHVSPRRYLTRLQEREMSAQPDLILQLAHHIEREFTARAGGPVEVRVEALVSLNGRRIRHLIDPEADLATVRDGIAPARWITPSPEEPPPHIQPI